MRQASMKNFDFKDLSLDFGDVMKTWRYGLWLTRKYKRP